MKTFEFQSQICSLGSNWQFASIGSDKGLAPNRQQAIILSNDGPVHQHIYTPHGLNVEIIFNQQPLSKLILTWDQ